MPPLGGVVHAAGVLDDGLLLGQTRERFEGAVFRSKLLGAWNLHALTRSDELDFFVLFSSAAAIFGSPGQASYAAANAGLDALAEARRAAGLPGQSIAWGPWSGVGLVAGEAERLELRGFGSFAPDEGAALFERLLGGSDARVGAVKLRLDAYHRAHPGLASAPWLSELDADRAGAPSGDVSSGATPASRDLLRALERAAPEARLSLVEARLRGEIAAVARLEPDRIASDAPFRQLGLDSLLLMEVRNRLERDLELRLPAAAFFSHPSIAAMAAHLLAKLSPAIGAAPLRSAPAPTEEPVAEPGPRPVAGAEGDAALLEELALAEKELFA
jgi:acyl carrier protein